ncbi:MAG: DNA replication and repair protein RecF [Candidatus Margulisiibacteriota bacterium]|jgi:DNA replication and repair protein RecF
MLKKIWIKDFRNLKEAVYTFDPGKNVFIFGENNQGKTNFLEAINLIGTALSVKDNHIKNLISFDKNECFIGGDFQEEDILLRIYLKIVADGKKFLVINNKPVKKISYLKENFFIEYLSIENIRYFIENSEYRRKSFDKFLSIYDIKYFQLIRNYHKLIKQKNILLKQRGKYHDLQIFNLKIIELADFIVSKRKSIIKIMIERFNTILINFNKLKDFRFDIDYQLYQDNNSETEYKDYLAGKLEKNYQKEIDIGYSLFGPHRDDFKIYLNEKELSLFYSRGINKLITLLFRYVEITLLREKYHYSPIILFDDVLTELDAEIKQEIVNIYEADTQLFYTSIDKEDKSFFKKVVTYQMINGELKNV